MNVKSLANRMTLVDPKTAAKYTVESFTDRMIVLVPQRGDIVRLSPMSPLFKRLQAN